VTGWFVTDEAPLAVETGECHCPGEPHRDNGDVIYLRRQLDVPGGMLVVSALVDDESEASPYERVGKAYLVAGICDWTFTDEAGARIPVTRALINQLAFTGAIVEVANAAADLYREAVIDPLVKRVSNSSPGGQSVKPTRRRSSGSADSPEP
jgi:hypothetical protein